MMFGNLVVLAACVAAGHALNISNVFGSHVVLQRAPAQARLWGTIEPHEDDVVVTFRGEKFPAATDTKAGTWEILLPPTPASTFTDLGEQIVIVAGPTWLILDDVLFGDVFLCSGQAYNGSEMIAEAGQAKYQSIRLFTSTPHFADTPLAQFDSVEQPWVRASSAAVGNTKPFSYFSAICWLTGKRLFDMSNGTVPLGLIVSAYGGTRVRDWSSPVALTKCDQGGSTQGSGLWNGMIYPLANTSLAGVLWMQAESDVNPTDGPAQPQRGASYYACQIKAMVADWRVHFNQPLPFIWVQLSPWVHNEAATSYFQLPSMRLAQLAVQALPLTGYVTAVDLGDYDPQTNPWGEVHFRNKAPLGPRLANAVNALVYGQQVQYMGPVAVKASGYPVTVSFDPATIGLGLTVLPAVCPYVALNDTVNTARCGWYDLSADGVSWHNATATVNQKDNTVVLQASGMTGPVKYARYLFADWPVATLYATTAAGDALPAFPFLLQVS